MDDETVTDDASGWDLVWVVAALVAAGALTATVISGDRSFLVGVTALLVAVHIRSVRRAAGVRRELAETAGRVRFLEWKATHDDLTGLPNRAALREAIERTRLARTQVVAMLVDLDDFKKVNDDHGHLAGDEVLRAAARRLRANLRADDVVGRAGGDEFIVLLATPVTMEELQRLAERVIDALQRPIAVGDVMVRISASIGMTTVAALDADFARVIAGCDGALYDAKRGGRGRAVALGGDLRAASGHLVCIDGGGQDTVAPGSDTRSRRDQSQVDPKAQSAAAARPSQASS